MADEYNEALEGVERIEEPPKQKPSVFSNVKERVGIELQRRKQENDEIKAAKDAAKEQAKMQIEELKEARRQADFESRKQKAVQQAVKGEYENARPVREKLQGYLEAAKLGGGRYGEFTKRASVDEKGRTTLQFEGEAGQLRDLVATTGGQRDTGFQSGGQLRALLSQTGEGGTFVRGMLMQHGAGAGMLGRMEAPQRGRRKAKTQNVGGLGVSSMFGNPASFGNIGMGLRGRMMGRVQRKRRR